MADRLGHSVRVENHIGGTIAIAATRRAAVKS